jgi:hypothetical protein
MQGGLARLRGEQASTVRDMRSRSQRSAPRRSQPMQREVDRLPTRPARRHRDGARTQHGHDARSRGRWAPRRTRPCVHSEREIVQASRGGGHAKRSAVRAVHGGPRRSRRHHDCGCCPCHGRTGRQLADARRPADHAAGGHQSLADDPPAPGDIAAVPVAALVQPGRPSRKHEADRGRAAPERNAQRSREGSSCAASKLEGLLPGWRAVSDIDCRISRGTTC